ncbi:MAG: Holliday junction branch migration protein RuvA [Patescibacteria group bacterium]|nr:Holliday junction branch migration protein RuvA [Patescibacteria group bacterium]
MIAYLKGTILEKGPAYIILETNGIGYKVFVTPEILEAKIGEAVSAYVYHKVSEDGQALFGVPDFNTLQLFELLVTVSGVGPKVALAILSATRAETVRQAIANQDPAVFTRVSGVGTKTAERIILELKNKMGALEVSGGIAASGDVFDALIALGYSQKEVREALKKIDANLPSQQQLKEALKMLGKA